jgi:hypothetical protein
MAAPTGAHVMEVEHCRATAKTLTDLIDPPISKPRHMSPRVVWTGAGVNYKTCLFLPCAWSRKARPRRQKRNRNCITVVSPTPGGNPIKLCIKHTLTLNKIKGETSAMLLLHVAYLVQATDPQSVHSNNGMNMKTKERVSPTDRGIVMEDG